MIRRALVAWLILSVAVVAAADDVAAEPVVSEAVAVESAPAAPAPLPPEADWWQTLNERDTLTNNWFGLGEQLAESGVKVNLGLTQIYQINVNGGARRGKHAGRYTGSYDLGVTVDMDTVAGVPGGTAYMLAEGGWSNGLDGGVLTGRDSDSSVFSNFGINADAIGDRTVDVTELWYQQNFFENRLRVRLGKIDLTSGFQCQGCPVAFDNNRFANDETTQFLNAALVNNPTIPFPENGLGVAVYLEPVDGYYLAAGCADAQADRRETGFDTAFHGEDYFFLIVETGTAIRIDGPKGPMPGTYRIGVWYDGRPKPVFEQDPFESVPNEFGLEPAGFSGVEDTGTWKRDDIGFYVSIDQLITRENTTDTGTQGLALFARYGYAHDDVNPIKCFWSVGAHYQGLIDGRDYDVLAFGVGRGLWSPLVGGNGEFAAKPGDEYATEMELYYSYIVTPWFVVSPSVQFIFDPDKGHMSDATVIGIRGQLAF